MYARHICSAINDKNRDAEVIIKGLLQPSNDHEVRTRTISTLWPRVSFFTLRQEQNILEANIRREVTILCLLQNNSPNIHPLLGTIALDPYIPPSPVFGYCKNGTITEVW